MLAGSLAALKGSGDHEYVRPAEGEGLSGGETDALIGTSDNAALVGEVNAEVLGCEFATLAPMRLTAELTQTSEREKSAP